MSDHPACMIAVAPGEYRCTRFGFVVRTAQLPIRCRCSADLAESLARRIAEALRAGECHWTGEEIERRLAICRECERFRGVDCRDYRACKGWQWWASLTGRGAFSEIRACPRWA